MKYYHNGKEITKEKARYLLECAFNQDYVNDIFDGGKSFRLTTNIGIIETKDENGMIPAPGFYGVCGKTGSGK